MARSDTSSRQLAACARVKWRAGGEAGGWGCGFRVKGGGGGNVRFGARVLAKILKRNFLVSPTATLPSKYARALILRSCARVLGRILKIALYIDSL